MIDGCEFVCKAFAAYLESRGFVLQTAFSAEEGLKKLKVWEPDLIVLDIALSRMGGVAFLKRLVAEHGCTRYPVIVFTAEREMEQLCRHLPISGFVLKSMYGAELLRKITQVLTEKRSVKEVEAVPVKTVVLLGEDEQVLQETIRATLERGGYEVLTAASGPEVMDRALMEKPDIVLMKEVLAGMNGSAVAARLKSTGKARHTPIILYDQVPLFEDLWFRTRPPDGVTLFVTTTEAAFLLQAVKDVLANMPKAEMKRY